MNGFLGEFYSFVALMISGSVIAFDEVPVFVGSPASPELD
jgi:hypothetical protein